MPEPAIGGRVPIVLVLEPGTYYWCACGHSKDQPFCDGSHETCPPLQPVEFVMQEEKRCSLCTCKRTHNAPFCDGSHKALPSDSKP